VLILVVVVLQLLQLRDKRVRERGIHSGVDNAVKLYISSFGVQIVV
jgi:hypothetical protein